MSPFPISPPPKHGRQMCLDARRILAWRLVFLSSTCTRPPSLASFYSVRPPRSRQNNINCRHPRPQSAQTICTRSAKERARWRPPNTPIAKLAADAPRPRPPSRLRLRSRWRRAYDAHASSRRSAEGRSASDATFEAWTTWTMQLRRWARVSRRLGSR